MRLGVAGQALAGGGSWASSRSRPTAACSASRWRAARRRPSSRLSLCERGRLIIYICGQGWASSAGEVRSMSLRHWPRGDSASSPSCAAGTGASTAAGAPALRIEKKVGPREADAVAKCRATPNPRRGDARPTRHGARYASGGSARRGARRRSLPRSRTCAAARRAGPAQPARTACESCVA